jgi:cholesterol transport system auxiliary component
VSWDDTVPDIVQAAAVEAFEDSGKIVAVGRQANGLRTDFELQLDLRDYEAVYHDANSPPVITMVLTAKLVDFTESRAVASHTFTENVTASSTAVPAVAQAFDSGLAALVHDVVGWTLETGQQARANDSAGQKR